MSPHILMIGGYGRAGLEIARLLLTHTEATLTLAGRTLAKAEAAAASLDSDRVHAAEVDISQASAVANAFNRCDMVIVCVPYPENTAETVITAALDAGIDYIDINADPAKHHVFDELANRIAQGSSIFLAEAGILPGCPAAMLRYAHARGADMAQATFGVVMLDDHMPSGSAQDMLAHAGQTPQVYRDKAWHNASPLAFKQLDFGDRFGKRLCVPIDLPETHALAERLAIEYFTVYQSGFNPAVNAIFLIWGLLGLTHTNWGLRTGVHLFTWANRNFTPPPHGIQVSLWADEDELTLFHEDVYTGTAIPVVAAVQQVIRGDVPRPAQGFMGHIVNPTQLLKDLTQMDMTVDTTFSIPTKENTT